MFGKVVEDATSGDGLGIGGWMFCGCVLFLLKTSDAEFQVHEPGLDAPASITHMISFRCGGLMHVISSPRVSFFPSGAMYFEITFAMNGIGFSCFTTAQT